MSEETKKVAIASETKEEALAADTAFHQQFGTRSIVRNGITKVLSIFKILKGDNKNRRYFAPQMTVETFDDDVQWYGKEYVVGSLNTQLKRAFQELWIESIDKETGLFNIDAFLSEGVDFTRAALKMAELDAIIEELQDKVGVLVLNGDLTPKADGTPSDDVLKIRELQQSVNNYKAMRDKKSRKGKEAQAEPAVEVK